MILDMVLLFLAVTLACFPHNIPETISFIVPIHLLMYTSAAVIAIYALYRLANKISISEKENENEEIGA